ncbi:copper chaperone PCu(A)C [Marinobacterium sp. D7]|uniref:copper chaperone PCu(A)C n=1 Tax=Marinobacterium ramblicola TaxID=2849041 RepID=UPI001C2DE37F|nr:copper chaperone PCu(A)C [Marinobacterium ramblicola]MBV1789591.1 copper chaperone PCu(A)C [Marinobacterium ramblicola]
MKALSTLLLSAALSTPLLAAEVQVNDPYARAVAPGQPNSAAFMQLENLGGQMLSLTGATSEVAQAVELHTHIQDQGVMRMRRINTIELPPHQRVSLQPGGLHIMLIGLTRTLSEGDEMALTLTFSDGSEQTFNMPVRPVMPMGAQKHGNNMGNNMGNMGQGQQQN